MFFFLFFPARLFFEKISIKDGIGGFPECARHFNVDSFLIYKLAWAKVLDPELMIGNHLLYSSDALDHSTITRPISLF